MKLSKMPPPLLILLVVSTGLLAFSSGDRTGQWLFPGWSAPTIAHAAPPSIDRLPTKPVQATRTQPDQENTLFILLGSPTNNTLATAWHISERPGSPVFMRLLIPSARYGLQFDQSFYDLDLRSTLSAADEQAIESLFAVHGLSWSRVVVLDLSKFAEALAELNQTNGGQFTIDAGLVLAPLPRTQGDTRSRIQMISDQITIWNGLCPLFLSTPVEPTGDPHLFRPHPAYPVCVASDDLH
jgi:hypothetical protein